MDWEVAVIVGDTDESGRRDACGTGSGWSGEVGTDLRYGIETGRRDRVTL